jgi:DNA replication factor GINS
MRGTMSPPEEMGFRYIQEVQQKESRSHNLTKLPADFFEVLEVHIVGLRELSATEVARDPMSTSATLVQNELKNTLRLIQDIVSLRLRKMANRAVDSLEGGKVDLRSLTPKEKDLYAEMARLISSGKSELFRPGKAKVAPVTPSMVAAPPIPSTETQPPAVEQDEDREKEGSEEGDDDKVLVHILADTPSFAGEEGRTYSLKKGDLVTLPQRLAQILLARKLAERIDEAGD